MLSKIILGLIWCILIIYTVYFTPPAQPELLNLVTKLYTGHWEGINSLVVALFWILTILPIIYAAVLLVDGKGQKIPAYPFVIASFGLGIYALLPYIALRQSNPNWDGKKNWLLKILDARITGIILSIAITIFFIWGIIYGDWRNLIVQFKTSQFINLMAWDLFLLCLLFPVIIKDDMIRRGINYRQFLWFVIVLPLFGTLIYSISRTKLASNSEPKHD